MTSPRTHYLTRLANGNGLTMFGHGPCDGLPTIATMSLLAKELKCVVHHFGMGCFCARLNEWDKDSEVFGFLGGGAMFSGAIGADLKPTFSWAPLSVVKKHKTRVLKALRVLLPNLPVTRDEARQALRDEVLHVATPEPKS